MEMTEWIANKQPLTIFYIDFDNFKNLNEVFGHAHGDVFLKKIADVMRRTCRADDIIARWGGDEFVILLPQTTIEQADRIKSRIKTEFARDGIKVIKLRFIRDIKRNDAHKMLF